MEERQKDHEHWDRGSWEIEISDSADTLQVRGEQYRIAGFIPSPDESSGVRLLLQFSVEGKMSGIGPPRKVAVLLDEKSTRRLQVSMAKLLADLDMRRQLERKDRGLAERDARKELGDV